MFHIPLPGRTPYVLYTRHHHHHHHHLHSAPLSEPLGLSFGGGDGSDRYLLGWLDIGPWTLDITDDWLFFVLFCFVLLYECHYVGSLRFCFYGKGGEGGKVGGRMEREDGSG